jgi:hypothetical protein
MKTFVAGILIGMCLSVDVSWAFRSAKPPTFYEWNPNTFTQLNGVLEDLWTTTNGLYTFNFTNSDPNGSLRGSRYEVVILDGVSTDKICVNMDGAKTWKCVTLS